MKIGLCIFSFFLFGSTLLAQHYKISKKIFANNQPQKIDTLIIIKGTLQVKHQNKILIEGLDYTFDYYTNLFNNLSVQSGEMLEVSYTPVFIKINNNYLNKHDSIVLPEFIQTINPFKVSQQGFAGINFLSDEGLDVTGSIMRGISVGNNQNAIVNANLNLQFVGKINNDINVLAAISDDNNPIQPEGNTQELQDFDQVFIQFNKNKNYVTVGDFLMETKPSDYFMKFYKKSRGLQAITHLPINPKNSLDIAANAAISRGRFVRNVINGIEGNQGPYRLTGPNGELFIIIISGTESVFIDGQKLTRGEQNDYVIDYNTGEITFTAKRLITAYSRIVVEFQYSDRNFARILFNFNTAFTSGNSTYYLNYYTEQDNKNQPFQQQLTDSAKKVLASVGNNLNSAFIPSESRQPFSSGKVLYRKIDTLLYTGIYVFASQPGNDSVFYEVRFSFVGKNKGNYIQSASAANGRVFKWVEPINGVPQGDFEPVIPLIAPNRMEMLTIGSIQQINKNTLLHIEGARSNFNRNLFSDFDKQNDAGYGLKVNLKNKTNLSEKITLINDIKYEWVDKNFRFIERYRDVEFDRIWNRQLTNQQTGDTGFNEHIVFYKISVCSNSINTFYQLGLYNRNANSVGAIQHIAGIGFKKNKTDGNLNTEWIIANSNIDNAVVKYNGYLGQIIGKFYTKIYGQTEQSNFKKDSLLPASFSYYQTGASIRNIDSASIKYFIEYNRRGDRTPTKNEFKDNTLANDVSTGFSVQQKNLNRLNLNTTLRQFNFLQQTQPDVLPQERTFLARAEYDYGLFKRTITGNTYIATGSGNELRRDFQFFEVQQGQGIYVWRDFNEDGIKQLNEFVPASFADRPLANYIKIILPTTSIIKTTNNQISQTLNINTPVKWQRSSGIKKIASYFNNQFAYRLDNKILTNALNLNKFLQNNYNDSELIAGNSLLRNTLFFNRSHPVFGADFTINQSTNQNLLTNGFESRNRKDYTLNTRWNITTDLTLNQSFVSGQRIMFNQFFEANNFNYDFFELKPKLIYQLQSDIRITVNYSFFNAGNKPEFGKEIAQIHEAGAETRFTLKKLGVLTIKYSLVVINFNGNVASPLAYDMLQGLNTGNNQLWNINLQQRLGPNLQININYDGRKAEGINTIHIGRMEARYLF
ncbi:MAG: hypothetical protein ACK4K9_07305 [Bacteroidia bacterium]